MSLPIRDREKMKGSNLLPFKTLKKSFHWLLMSEDIEFFLSLLIMMSPFTLRKRRTSDPTFAIRKTTSENVVVTMGNTIIFQF